jgi:hypothetical protein
VYDVMALAWWKYRLYKKLCITLIEPRAVFAIRISASSSSKTASLMPLTGSSPHGEGSKSNLAGQRTILQQQILHRRQDTLPNGLGIDVASL